MTSDPINVDLIGEAEDFDRLCNRVLSGRHLPTFPQLLQGVPFLKNDIAFDADVFARRFLATLSCENDPDEHLSVALSRLTASHDSDAFEAAALAFTASITNEAVIIAAANEAIGRCWFYAAISGDRDAAKRVASAAIALEINTEHMTPALRQLKGVLAWTLAAAGSVVLPSSWTRTLAEQFLCHGELLEDCLNKLVERTIERRNARRYRTDEIAASILIDDTVTKSGTKSDDVVPGSIVFTTIGNPDTSEGKRVDRSLKSLLGKRMRLIIAPDLELARSTLTDEFPHALTVINAVLEPLRTAEAISLLPTILVGPPGCGKSTFALRLADVLALPIEVFPCGGVSDSALAGTPRRWTSGEPSLPVQVIQAKETANPLIILDEIEKASTSRHNGALLDCLLSLWEPRTAQAWRDPYIEAPVDLSHVNWVCTANSLEGVPRPIRDRARVLSFPAPGREHVRTLAFHLMRNLAHGDPRWVRPLDGLEASALERAWTDGSLRSLARMLASILKAREMFDARH